MDNIHPLVLKVAAKLVPVPIGGMAADVKFLVNQLRNSEECGGWQYIMTSFFDQVVGHPTYRFEERTICFCVPDKFRVRVRIFSFAIRVHTAAPLVWQRLVGSCVCLVLFPDATDSPRMKCGSCF